MIQFGVQWSAGSPRSGHISEAFTEAERERFHNLLLLAAESPFEGERVNAIEAATRLAAKHGMTLQEAARADAAPPPPPPQPTVARWAPQRDVARFVHMSEQFIKADKKRREEALQEARDRGLDADERRSAAERPSTRAAFSRAKRNGVSHARVLLAETTLPLQEVADLSGLDIYQVVGMKLKMRASA